MNYLKSLSKSQLFTLGIIIIYTVGIIGFSIPNFRSLFQSLTPLNLMGGFIVLMLFHEKLNTKFVVIASSIAILGFTIEMIGVNTGIIFGEYSYGKTLGIGLMNTPFLIGLNWLLLVYMSWDIIGRITENLWVKISVSALLMLLYDFIMEPVAMLTDMWQWPSSEIPMQNYIAWFLIAAFMFGILAFSKLRFRNPMSVPLFIAQLVFFGFLNILI